MKKPLKVMSGTALAAVLVASAVVPTVSAAPASSLSEVIFTKDGVNYKVSYSTYNALVDANKAAGLSVQYVTAPNGETYSVSEYNLALDAYKNDISLTLDALDSAGTPVNVTTVEAKFDEKGDLVTEAPATDLEVVEVSAINATVYKAVAEQKLAVQINGKQSVTVAELEEAGYTVSFSANKAVFVGGSTTSTTGELLADFGTITDFNYTVTVEKGEESFTSKTTGKVTVVDATATKTITELELQDSAEKALTSTTVTLDDTTLKVVPTKGTNVKGEEITEFTGVTYKSSNNAVALVSADGKITPVSAGTATITVTSGEGSKTITLTVAEATRVITTVKADVTAVGIVESGSQDVVIKAFDQFGDAISTGSLTVTSAKETIATANPDGSKVTIAGVAKGSTTVTVKAGTKTISIPVTVGENKVDTYKLELVKVADQSEDNVIDVANAKDNAVTVAYNGYNTANQLVGAAALEEYIAENPAATLSYEVVEKDINGNTANIVEVAAGENGKITLTATATGTATVNVYDGALKVASYKVTVNNSTPTVTKATLIKDAKVTSTDATAVLKASGLTFTSTPATAVVFDVAEGGKSATIKDSAESAATLGTLEILDNLDSTKGSAVVSVAEGVHGELLVTVSRAEGSTAAVTGTVTVRVKDTAGKIVSVGTIDVDIAKVAPAEAPGEEGTPAPEEEGTPAPEEVEGV
ncbi:Ig domain-containing protein [Psychrobacillus sp. NPDC096426]|uniref:Ig-like domain-containing protein n=1 Tax=Psychrobacillus sp. NPDC096426 TaxID=3364491 RepID=UPI00381F5D5E